MTTPNVPCWIATQTIGRKPYVVTDHAFDHDTPATAIPNERLRELEAATQRAAAAERERDEAVGLLRDIEWCGDVEGECGSNVCPCCHGRKPIGGHFGHADTCDLAALLALVAWTQEDRT